MTSYQYGRSLVSITDEDEAAAKFEGGPKAMCLFGFVPRDEIQASEAQLEAEKYILGHGQVWVRSQGHVSLRLCPTGRDQTSERPYLIMNNTYEAAAQVRGRALGSVSLRLYPGIRGPTWGWKNSLCLERRGETNKKPKSNF